MLAQYLQRVQLILKPVLSCCCGLNLQLIKSLPSSFTRYYHIRLGIYFTLPGNARAASLVISPACDGRDKPYYSGGTSRILE
jgi:hypothetical protein